MSPRPKVDVVQIKRDLANIGPLEICRRLGLEKGAMRQPAGWHIRCPSHNERSPSCSVTVARDRTIRVHCFGCGLSGDVFTLIAAVHGLDARISFRSVLQHAVDLSGGASHYPELAPPPERPSLSSEAFHRLVSMLIDLCPLDAQRDVVRYLEGRRIIDDVRGHWAALPRSDQQPELVRQLFAEFGEEAVRLSGLLHIEEPRFAWPRHRVLIPWRDEDGTILNLQRRGIQPTSGDTPKYVTPRARSFSQPYGVHMEHHDARDLVIVEGAVDVHAARLLFARSGWMPRVVGVPGLEAWRESWAKLGWACKVLVGFDADKAGDAHVAKISKAFQSAGAGEVKRLRPAGGAKDWGSVLEQSFEERGAA